ncbi:MAG: SoxR reducing system RseC family protein [Ectothiorhodospiraceae bacterium]|nr:SoxR reducing system RseC family protein [Ectothiorhodospiraceae bacterium]MCH8503045.1 SoxR reducing system RseC family protein [Ectothiorhodospiraceae bacterium]
MMRESGMVLEITHGTALIATQRRSVCSSCAVRAGCGTATLASFFGHRREQISVNAPETLRAGDPVLLEFDDSALLAGSALVYGLPLIGLLGGALLGGMLAGEAAAVATAFGGLAGGAVVARHRARRAADDPRFHPRVSPCGNGTEQQRSSGTEACNRYG